MYVYYAGHGACDNDTYLILDEEGGKMFPLEKSLRVIADMDNTYVIALFDCCREKIDKSNWRGTGQSYDEDADLGALFQA